MNAYIIFFKNQFIYIIINNHKRKVLFIDRFESVIKFNTLKDYDEVNDFINKIFSISRNGGRYSQIRRKICI